VFVRPRSKLSTWLRLGFTPSVIGEDGDRLMHAFARSRYAFDADHAGIQAPRISNKNGSASPLVHPAALAGM
jgi:hypothetical protein